MDQRLLLSGGGKLGLHPEHSAARCRAHGRAGFSSKPRSDIHYKRLTPTAEINAQYTAFLTAFNQQLDSYVASLNQTINRHGHGFRDGDGGLRRRLTDHRGGRCLGLRARGHVQQTRGGNGDGRQCPAHRHFHPDRQLGNSLTINIADSSSIPMQSGPF